MLILFGIIQPALIGWSYSPRETECPDAGRANRQIFLVISACAAPFRSTEPGAIRRLMPRAWTKCFVGRKKSECAPCRDDD